MAPERGGKNGAALSATSLGSDVPEGATLLLDTSLLVAYFGGTEPTAAVAAAVVDGFVRSGRNTAVVSVVTIAELLVRPLRVSDASLADRLVEFLAHFPNLKLAVVDLQVAREAALLRARLGLGSPDALIVGTGLVKGCRHIVSNDHAWSSKLTRSSAPATVVVLDDHLPFPA